MQNSSKQPQNIFLIIADSLRFDTVHDQNIGLPYVESNGMQFLEARSSGCWTLPATASIFTGLLPHEHGATSQTRQIDKSVPTLAELLKKEGYNTFQITANVATTHIFGLDRGFDEVLPIWDFVNPKFKKFHQLLVMFGKPRIRKKMFSKDLVAKDFSEDLNAAKSWMQNTYLDSFDKARTIFDEHKNEKNFFFINMMETHFPYHIDDTFRALSDGMIHKFKEFGALYHTLNQTFMRSKKDPISSKMKETLRNRQKLSWQIIRKKLDAFVQEVHEDQNNLVVFGADHGDNFGEQGWMYHFSNVTDAGNKIPLFWLDNDSREAKKVVHPVSARHIFNSILERCNVNHQGPALFEENEVNLPILQSYWYNNKGKTLPTYKYNQFCFLNDDTRYVLRNDQWLSAPKSGETEPLFEPLSQDVNPLEDMIKDETRREHLKNHIKNFQTFSDKIL